MKAYLATVLVIDFDDNGIDSFELDLQRHRHTHGRVIHLKEFDIGEWSDDNLLNQTNDYRKIILYLDSLPEPNPCKE